MDTKKKILLAILVLAVILRFWGLDRGDTMNDEVFYAFRAIGLLDFDAAERQTTPLEWFDPGQNFAPQNLGGQASIPSWTKLSFHDHPPLVFWTQGLFIKIFGEKTWAFRLPSAILGIASVYLLYLIGARLYSYRIGLLASALMAVTLNHVYISRTGMQEAYVIFFLLLASYFFLKSLRSDTYLLWLGAALGFALLTKFTLLILVPILLTAFLIFKKEYFFRWKLWVGAVLALIIFSPVIIYNLKMYQAVGHFDFQFSALFGQHPAVWQEQPGKEIGTLYDRLRVFVPRLISTHSWAFLAVFASALAAFVVRLARKFRETLRLHGFIAISTAYLVLLLIFIGPSFRFLTMLTPFLALASALFLLAMYDLFQTKSGIIKYTVLVIFGLFLSFETAYSYNNQIAYYPVGPQPWLASKIRFENYNWGYNALDQYLEKKFSGKMPAFTFDPVYKFLDDVREESLREARERGLAPKPFLIVYSPNFDDGAFLWVLLRRHVHHAWPTIKLEDYFSLREKYGADFFRRSGFRDISFIFIANFMPPPNVADEFIGVEQEIIFNQRGDEAFRVYHVSD